MSLTYLAGGGQPYALGEGFTSSGGLVLKYSCGSKFPLRLEVTRHTWRLSICKETHVKSMDGTTTKQIIQNVSTLTFDHYYGHDNNIDASVNMLDYQGWESLVNQRGLGCFDLSQEGLHRKIFKI